jgi:hypothetical protein
VYNDVVKFIEACEQEKTLSNSILYTELIAEEYQEFLDANYDVEELDACMDMIWVILGYCYMRVGMWKVHGMKLLVPIL